MATAALKKNLTVENTTQVFGRVAFDNAGAQKFRKM